MMRTRILVVDEEVEILNVVEECLTPMGYGVDIAATPERALQLLTQDAISPYALLLTDVMMPTMAGVKLGKKAHELRPAMAVVFMTGWAGLDLPAGCQVLAKPLRKQRLKETIQKALAGSSEMQ